MTAYDPFCVACAADSDSSLGQRPSFDENVFFWVNPQKGLRKGQYILLTMKTCQTPKKEMQSGGSLQMLVCVQAQDKAPRLCAMFSLAQVIPGAGLDEGPLRSLEDSIGSYRKIRHDVDAWRSRRRTSPMVASEKNLLLQICASKLSLLQHAASKSRCEPHYNRGSGSSFWKPLQGPDAAVEGGSSSHGEACITQAKQKTR